MFVISISNLQILLLLKKNEIPAIDFLCYRFAFYFLAIFNMSELEKLYHEKQRRQLCLLHTLNNVFQREEFKKEELDQFCET
jgi:hypothetical protein